MKSGSGPKKRKVNEEEPIDQNTAKLLESGGRNNRRMKNNPYSTGKSEFKFSPEIRAEEKSRRLLLSFETKNFNELQQYKEKKDNIRGE